MKALLVRLFQLINYVDFQYKVYKLKKMLTFFFALEGHYNLKTLISFKR